MEFRWEDGSEIRISVDNNVIVISANKEGLLSLANHFRDLAESGPGGHFHLDEHNSLEDGSAELIVEKIL